MTSANPYWPLPQPDSLGQIYGADDVRNAVKNTILTWSPYYLAVISDRLVDAGLIGAPGQPSCPLNNFGVWDNDPKFRSLGTGQPAAFLVTCEQLGTPVLQGNRQYRGSYRATVAIWVYGTTWEQCTDRTSWYEKATRTCILNQRRLGLPQGLVTGTKWQGSKSAPMQHESTRSLAECAISFDVGLSILSEIRGPASVPSITEPPPQDPTVATTAVTLELVPDTETLEVEED